MTGVGLLVKAGQGQVLVTDANLDAAPERGLAGILPMLGGRLPVVLG